MSHQEWTKQLFQELKLPTTPEEWRKLSEENKIGPANPSKQDLKDGLYDQDVYPFEAPTKNIHFGDPAAWGSGSEIQHGHFMTTRVPWTMLVVEKLVDFDLLRLSRKPRRGAIESLLDYPDFLTYCEDIGRYQETRPLEQNPMIGAFTGIRDMQLDQPRLSKEIGSSKGFSERSATKAQTTKTTSSEAALRAAFVILPDLLCLPLRIPLRWKLDKPRFVLAQGKARIVAVVDGHLTERNISTEQDNDSSGSYAVVKVKPYLLRLATNFRPTLIQIGIEMMAWIAHCVKSERPKKRYAMLAQFCNEMWIVVANCSEKYREFLNSGGRTPSADDPSAFLNLQMNGPFDIFTQKDVIIHAAIVVALTIQLYTEAQPGAGEGEGESKDEGGGQGGDEDEDGNEGKGESGDEGSDQNGGDDEDEIKRSIRQLLE